MNTEPLNPTVKRSGTEQPARFETDSDECRGLNAGSSATGVGLVGLRLGFLQGFMWIFWALDGFVG